MTGPSTARYRRVPRDHLGNGTAASSPSGRRCVALGLLSRDQGFTLADQALHQASALAPQSHRAPLARTPACVAARSDLGYSRPLAFRNWTRPCYNTCSYLHAYGAVSGTAVLSTISPRGNEPLEWQGGRRRPFVKEQKQIWSYQLKALDSIFAEDCALDCCCESTSYLQETWMPATMPCRWATSGAAR